MSASTPQTRALIVLADPVLASTLAAALAHRNMDAVGPFSEVDDALPAVLHHAHLVAILDVGLPKPCHADTALPAPSPCVALRHPSRTRRRLHRMT